MRTELSGLDLFALPLVSRDVLLAGRVQGLLVFVVGFALAVPWCCCARVKAGLVQVLGQHLTPSL